MTELPALHLDRHMAFQLPGPRWTWHKRYNIWVCLHGKGMVRAPEGEFPIEERACFVFRDDAAYFGETDPENPALIYGIHFSAQGPEGDPVASRPRPLYRKIESLRFFQDLTDRMSAAVQTHGDNGGTLAADIWLRALVAEIDRIDSEPDLRGLDRAQVETIEAIRREIRENPGAEHRVEEIARRLHCSRAHFSRLFRRYTGMTPQDFIVKTRIDAAKDLLLSSSTPVGVIAHLLGYNSIYHFSRQFRQKAGVSPMRYRRTR